MVLLEEKEQELLKQFLDARAATATKRAEFDRHIQTVSTPTTNLINSKLPTELLLSILYYSAFTTSIPYHRRQRKEKLASVCRRWRDIIHRNPRFWTTIHVPSNISSMEAHLKRSCGIPLDIVISIHKKASEKHFVSSLDKAVSQAHRWHTLEVDDFTRDKENGRSLLPDLISEKTDFPSLRRVIIKNRHSTYDITHLNFLSPAHSPALEHLELDKFVGTPDFLPLTLNTLKLSPNNGWPFKNQHTRYCLSLPNLIVTQALMTLSLSGQADVSRFEPNSIPFPSLNTLEMINVTGVRQFMDAIVAPNLERFTYISTNHDGDPPSTVFDGFGSKFTSVHHLLLSNSATSHDRSLDRRDAWVLCEAFPRVRHVELKGGSLPLLFGPSRCKKPGSDGPPARPISTWTELESFTINGLNDQWLDPAHLPAWLVNRRIVLGLQRLHVTLKGSTSSGSYYGGLDDHIGIRNFAELFECLKENCVLDLDNFHLIPLGVFLSMSRNSPLRVVSPYNWLQPWILFSPHLGLEMPRTKDEAYG